MSVMYPEENAAAIALGNALRDEAMRRVEEHAPGYWRACADEAVRYVAWFRQEFTTDAVKAVLRSWGVPPAPEERAWGPVIKAACSRGWIEPTGRVHLSVEPGCHRRPKAVWRSRLYAQS